MQRVNGVLRTIALSAAPVLRSCVIGLLLLQPAAAQPSGGPVIYLDQAWSQHSDDPIASKPFHSTNPPVGLALR